MFEGPPGGVQVIGSGTTALSLSIQGLLFDRSAHKRATRRCMACHEMRKRVLKRSSEGTLVPEGEDLHLKTESTHRENSDAEWYHQDHRKLRLRRARARGPQKGDHIRPAGGPGPRGAKATGEEARA